MKTYTVKSLESWGHECTYVVEANSKFEAEELCKSGVVEPIKEEEVEGYDVWHETYNIGSDALCPACEFPKAFCQCQMVEDYEF